MSDSPNLIIANPFHPETVAKLDDIYNTHHLWTLSKDEKLALVQSLKGSCSAVASASWSCDPAVYSLDSLQFIGCFGVGVDGVDFDRAADMNVRVSNTPDVLNDAVADIAIALILGITRNIVNADAYVRSKSWQKSGPFEFGQSLQGKTLGILGLGRIGKAIAERALPFGLKIAYHNRNQQKVPYDYISSIEELAASSDILLCMLPGGPETKHLINERVLQKLGPNGYFINVGRGSSVDEQALARALSEGVIAGAGLDVYENEPRVPDALLAQSNLVLLPHIGSATEQTRRAMGQLVIDNLEAYFANKPLLTEYLYR